MPGGARALEARGQARAEARASLRPRGMARATPRMRWAVAEGDRSRKGGCTRAMPLAHTAPPRARRNTRSKGSERRRILAQAIPLFSARSDAMPPVKASLSPLGTEPPRKGKTRLIGDGPGSRGGKGSRISDGDPAHAYSVIRQMQRELRRPSAFVAPRVCRFVSSFRGARFARVCVGKG